MRLSVEEVFRKVDEKEDRIINILRKLISINTTVPPGNNYDQMVYYLENEFKKLNFFCERVLVPEEEWSQIPYLLEGDRINLVAKKEEGKKPVAIYAHMDVVPIGEGWDVDPFAGTVKEGKIYGRGASDTKGSIASLLVALEIIREFGIESKFDIHCLLCTDEEMGMYPGVYYLAREGYIPDGPMISIDGTQDPLIWLGSSGTIDVSIRVKGKSCHSGKNFLGVNAIEESIPILNELINLKKEVEKRKSEIPAMKIPQAPSSRITPMFNINIIKGGLKSNIVPSECTIIVNRRYIIEENYNEVEGEIKVAIEKGKNKSRALAVEVKFFHIYPPIKVDPNNQYALKMKEAVKKVQGYEDEDFVEAGLMGSTDMAFVQMVTGKKDIIQRGVDRVDSNIHSQNEFAYLKDLKALAKELIYFLTQ